MRRKLVIPTILLSFSIPIMVNATGGGLRKNTLKTCPNGVTYGMHSDGNGGTHWHIAITNGKNYYADGEAIYSDPCPGYNKNEGTAGSTNGESTSNHNNSTNGGSTSNYNNSNSYTTSSNKSNYMQPIIDEKSKDNTLKKVVIDDEEIPISDSMNLKTEKKNITIKIELSDLKANVDYENRELSFGENIINVIVTAENGDKKVYKLIINRIHVKGTATLKEFKLGSGKVEFKNNKATITKLKNESSLDYSYKLSDENANLNMYLNETKVTEFESVKDKDKIKLVVIDENDNENLYEITIKDAPIIYSFIIYGILALLLLSPIIGFTIAIVIIKKKKQSSHLISNK